VGGYVPGARKRGTICTGFGDGIEYFSFNLKNSSSRGDTNLGFEFLGPAIFGYAGF
jgi:hypothetical protein